LFAFIFVVIIVPVIYRMVVKRGEKRYKDEIEEVDF